MLRTRMVKAVIVATLRKEKAEEAVFIFCQMEETPTHNF